MLQWSQSQAERCPWVWTAAAAAIEGGHLGVHVAVLDWMRAQEPPIPAQRDECEVAARAGQLQVLQWLRAQFPP